MAAPFPSQLPAATETPLAKLLETLEEVLEGKAPRILDSLQPGISDADLTNLQSATGLVLNEEMKTLYRWHNGQYSNSAIDFVPGHSFPSIDTVVAQRDASKQQLRQATLIQRVFYWLVCRHRKNWMTIFEDGAGDGYFYDSKRKAHQGPIFFCFQETGDYTFFPSLGNLIEAVTQCYDEGAYRVTAPRQSHEDYERAVRIMKRFGCIAQA